MPRARSGTVSRRRHNKVRKATKGYWGLRKNVYRHARETLERALQFAYRDRKNRKRDFRALWISRINAAARQEGISYSRFMQGLKAANIELDRKILSKIAIEDSKAFSKLVAIAKQNGG